MNPNDEEIVLTILRTYPGIYDMPTIFNSALIAKKSNHTEAEVNQVLKKLQEKEVIAYTAKNNDAVLVFNEVREDDKTINRIAKYLENQNQLKVDQLESVLQYVNNKNSCKSQLLLAYFGEKEAKPCGICSYCISKSKPKSDVALVTQSILENLKSADLNSREIEKAVPFATKDIIFALQLLLDNGIILLKTNNQYTLVK